MDDDDPRREDELDGDGAQEDLHDQKNGGETGRAAQGRLGAVPSPGHQGHGEDEETHQGGGPSVADLDQGREIERGEPLAVTPGPVIPAPHAGAGDPHHPTQNDQPERQSRSGPGQLPEETGAVGMGLETQGIRPPQVSGGKRKVRGSSLSTLYLAMPSPVTDQWGERLPRHLGLWSAIAVLVGSTIGSGIFRVPAGVAQRLHDPGPVVVAWIIGGAVALFGALTLAELAAALPRSGGVFAYLLEGFGPLPAFLFGWSELTVIRASALGAIATIFAEYLGYFVELSPEQV